ncbi:11206_t:CDS:2 [Scutellospora calospora]|uniref:11206_t:CDS:1 n=1 Tax=Scutellospora calospora TaxID=85575 RepID=A0ACA9K437_9GLOM|nr:11206_t:CDS:2 [Scutellospora calospora]
MTPVQALGFLTGFFNYFKQLNINICECGIDATWLELYILYAEIDSSEYPIAYLFLESNSKSRNRIQTDTILTFLNEIKLQGLLPEFILTDKDFTQISAIRFTWPNAKIQLYH